MNLWAFFVIELRSITNTTKHSSLITTVTYWSEVWCILEKQPIIVQYPSLYAFFGRYSMHWFNETQMNPLACEELWHSFPWNTGMDPISRDIPPLHPWFYAARLGRIIPLCGNSPIPLTIHVDPLEDLTLIMKATRNPISDLVGVAGQLRELIWIGNTWTSLFRSLAQWICRSPHCPLGVGYRSFEGTWFRYSKKLHTFAVPPGQTRNIRFFRSISTFHRFKWPAPNSGAVWWNVMSCYVYSFGARCF